MARYAVDLSPLGSERLDRVPECLSSFHGGEDWILRRRFKVSPDDGGDRGEAGQRLDAPPDDPRIRTVDMKKACIELIWDPDAAGLQMLLRILDANGQTANPTHVLPGILGLSAEERASCPVTRTAILRADRSAMAEVTS